MYHPNSQRLGSPPPSSLFRRPWSPAELESYGGTTEHGVRHQPSTNTSVEVLDLDEYSRMAPHGYHGNTGLQRPSYLEYPSTPPRTFSLASRASMPASPPSLVSGDSSSSHARLHTPPPLQRPLSFTAPRIARSPPTSNSGHSHNYPWLVESLSPTEYRHKEEIDASTFPEWSRNWYANDKFVGSRLNPYTPITTFDPALVSQSYDDLGSFRPTGPHASTNQFNRDLLPWSAEDDSSVRRVTPEMKEERMKMLEREFGRVGKEQHVWYPGLKVIGSVDSKGKIITPGPKKRAMVRWTQATLALGAVIASLYSAFILKPTGDPPPRGALPAYLLYVLSVLTISLIVFVYMIRPCCRSGKSSRRAKWEGPGGMMVLPVQQLPGAPVKKKRGKKKRKDDAAGGISVNLIVDPTIFMGKTHRDEDETDDDGTEISLGRPERRRRGLFEGLAMEEQWKEARKRLKHMLAFDTVLCLLWTAEFVAILLGKRCSPGKFEGWCDSYNTATALVAFLSLSFGFSTFFDVKDLHLSKASPRTRT